MGLKRLNLDFQLLIELKLILGKKWSINTLKKLIYNYDP